MNEEKPFSGVDALIERMELYPEEFFEVSQELNKRSRWTFMYKDYFRDAMTEAEKGRLHEAIRKMRRLEFDATVLKELMKDQAPTEVEVEEEPTIRSNRPQQTGWWNKAPVKKEGGRV